VVALRRDNVDRVPTEMIRYLNRLSDWFFAAARWSNRRAGAQEGLWP
jgi:cob(I)alamin adenosyltransferase